jgi:hypothetical protein
MPPQPCLIQTPVEVKTEAPVEAPIELISVNLTAVEGNKTEGKIEEDRKPRGDRPYKPRNNNNRRPYNKG